VAQVKHPALVATSHIPCGLLAKEAVSVSCNLDNKGYNSSEWVQEKSHPWSGERWSGKNDSQVCPNL